MYPAIKTTTSAAAILLLMLFPVKSFSQTSKFGVSINTITANYNYGKSNSDLTTHKKNFKGIQAGFSYQAGITPVFSVVPGFYFSAKGGSLKEHNPLSVNKSTLRIYGLELPVLARLHCNNLYLNAGPYAGYNIGGRMKIEGSVAIPATTTKVSFGNDINAFKRWDMGILAGAGYNFSMKRAVLTLDVRYSYGLTNISKDIERYNRVLNIGLVLSKQYKQNRHGTTGGENSNQDLNN